MKFEISRASDVIDAEKPCEGATLKGASPSGLFKKWEIEIDSLDALMAMVDSVGAIILTRESIMIDDIYGE